MVPITQLNNFQIHSTVLNPKNWQSSENGDH